MAVEGGKGLNDKRLLISITISVVILSLSIYMVLPEYTIAQAEESFIKQLPEDVTLSKLDISPITKRGFDSFSARGLYTFQVTESTGATYFILFHPDSGEYFKQ